MLKVAIGNVIYTHASSLVTSTGHEKAVSAKTSGRLVQPSLESWETPQGVYPNSRQDYYTFTHWCLAKVVQGYLCVLPSHLPLQ